MSRRSLLSALLVVSTAAPSLGGCAWRESKPRRIPVVVDADCREAGVLERDLSDDATYRGEDQIYLDERGRPCRFFL